MEPITLSVNNMVYHIRERFRDKKHSIDLLTKEDPEFFTLCEDHDACVDAIRYWAKSEAPEAEARVDEYHTLVRELEEEITQALEALKSRRLD
jgi:uncharacterized protein YdcH (DUF465 family)